MALRFAPAAGTWELLGDAAEYGLGETRKEILEAVRAHGTLTPKAGLGGHERRTRPRQEDDAADVPPTGSSSRNEAVYSLSPPVPGVPESPSDSHSLSPSLLRETEGQEGQGSTGAEPDPAELDRLEAIADELREAGVL